MTETLVLLDNTVLSNFSVAQQPGLAIQACPGRACTTIAAGYRSPVENLAALLKAGR